jgi:ribulose 1,5-bisphosphate synthetase/thiazole synthase
MLPASEGLVARVIVVIIIGDGPGGLSAALFLAPGGHAGEAFSRARRLCTTPT